MEGHDAAPPSSGGLTALSHRLMSKFRSSSEERPGPAADFETTSSKSGNLVFSPLSIYSALSLAAAGARGSTLTELLDALGAKSRESLAENVRGMVDRALPGHSGGGGPRVAHACGVWHDATKRFKPAYHNVAAVSCNAVAHAVDFITKPEEARKEINSWVAKKTDNLIDSILEKGKVTEHTRLVVATALYFKGVWEKPFDKDLTKEGKFHRLDGSTADAQFMRSHRDQFIATHDGFKVLRMPYAAVQDPLARLRAAASAVLPRAPPPPRYSMCVFLPNARDGLRQLEDTMAASSPGFLQDHMPERRVEVGDFRVPKFKLSFYTSLKRVLQDLGVKTVFDLRRAELPDMVEDDGEPSLYLDEVLHKAVIEVNEEGTEAAASTALVFMPGSAGPGCQRPKPVDFVADHPFAFFVVEEVSGAILFAGHVLDPTKS